MNPTMLNDHHVILKGDVKLPKYAIRFKRTATYRVDIESYSPEAAEQQFNAKQYSRAGEELMKILEEFPLEVTRLTEQDHDD